MIGANIRALRKSRKLTLEQLSNELNSRYPNTLNFNKGKLSKWENGKEEPKLSSVRVLADFFDVSLDDLVHGGSNKSLMVVYEKLQPIRKRKVYNFAERQLEEQNKIVSIRVYGDTAAGEPITYGDPEVEEKEVSHVPHGADMALNVKGDSMEPLIEDGTIIFYKRQEHVENGEIAIVEIEGECVTCKRVKYDYDNERIILQSENTEYEDMVFESNEIRILGKVIL